MSSDWPTSNLPGWTTVEYPSQSAASDAFSLAEQQAGEAGYHVTTTWNGPACEAEMLFWRDADERRRVAEAPSFRDWPRPVAALRWVWPASKEIEPE
jgi:hypothetical protein